MDTAYWEQKYRESVKRFEDRIGRAGPVFLAFNTNIDRIKKVDQAFLDWLGLKSFRHGAESGEINRLDDFRAGLVKSMRMGKAVEWLILNQALHDHLDKTVSFESERLGGQIGIAANLLAHIGVNDVVIYAPHLSARTARLYDRDVLHPYVKEGELAYAHPSECSGGSPKTNFVFEYRKGLKVKLADEAFVVPRSNRFIASHTPKGRLPLFDDSLVKHFPKLFRGVRRAFLSGYQSIEYDDTFYKAAAQLDAMKKANPRMKVHLEFVSVENERVARSIVEKIMKRAHSLGCNERETCIILNALREQELIRQCEKENYSAYSLFKAAEKIREKTGLERIHIHNIGFFLVLLDKSYPATPEEVRRALLYASDAVLTRAVMGYIYEDEDVEMSLKHHVHKIGLGQLEELGRRLGKDMGRGIAEFDDYYLICIPMKAAQRIKTTVGLGDTISSVALVGELV